MTKMKGIILDDEISAVTNIKILIEKFCPKIEIVLAETNPLKVIPLLSEGHEIDVLFIDISMGNVTGFDLLKLIDLDSLKVVFVTAHADKAIESIEFRPFGYLLKPIDIDKLVEVYERLINMDQPKLSKDIAIDSQVSKLRMATTDGFIWLVRDDILYVEADRSYAKIIMNSELTHVISKSLSWFLESIDSDRIIRCHRSYAVNIDKIVRFSNRDGGFITLEGGRELPLGKDKKQEIMDLLK